MITYFVKWPLVTRLLGLGLITMTTLLRTKGSEMEHNDLDTLSRLGHDHGGNRLDQLGAALPISRLEQKAS